MTVMDNVTMRIVPSRARERSALGGAFQLMEFQEHRPIVSVDALRFGGLIVEDREYVGSYQELVMILAEVALDEGQSREFVAAMADVYDRGSRRGDAVVVAQE